MKSIAGNLQRAGMMAGMSLKTGADAIMSGLEAKEDYNNFLNIISTYDTGISQNNGIDPRGMRASEFFERGGRL